MAIRKIALEGEPILRKKCRPVTEFNERLWNLLDDMWETMYRADGVGLAGPQVFIMRRVAVVDTGEDERFELINPEFLSTEGEQISNEGCLSVPGPRMDVKRPMKVEVRYTDRFGESRTATVEGFTATAFCHEMDHMDGILYTDKAIPPEEK